MTWGYVAVGAATVVGGAIAADASRSAANKQRDAAQQSTDVQERMYQQTREDNLPALQSRNTALQRLQSLLGTNTLPSARDVQNEAGYQFGLQQGQQALQRQATARGMSNSGQALTAAARYGNDYAATKYNDAFNRLQSFRQQQWNEGASLAGLGQTGASQVASSGQNFANAAGQNALAVGNVQAASTLAQGNAWANAGNQLAGWYANYKKQPAATSAAPQSDYGIPEYM